MDWKWRAANPGKEPSLPLMTWHILLRWRSDAAEGALRVWPYANWGGGKANGRSQASARAERRRHSI